MDDRLAVRLTSMSDHKATDPTEAKRVIEASACVASSTWVWFQKYFRHQNPDPKPIAWSGVWGNLYLSDA